MVNELKEQAIEAAHPDTKPAGTADLRTTEIRRVMREQRNPSALEGFTSAVESRDRLDRDSSRAIIAENIGTAVDSRGNKVRTTEETSLLQKALAYEEESGILLEKGYGSTEFASHQDDLRQTAEEILMSLPEIAAIIPTDATEKNTFLDAYINNPKLMAIIRRKYIEAHSGGRTIVDSVTQATIDFEAAKRADKELGKKIRDAKAKIAELTATLDRFKPGASDDLDLTRLSKIYGPDTINLRAAELQMTRIDETIGRLDLIRVQREDAGEDTGDLDVRIHALQIQRDKLETEKIIPLQQNIQEHDRLVSLKATSEQELRTEQASLEELEGQRPDIIRDKAIKQAALEQARRKTITDTRNYVRDLDILPAAIIEYERTNLREAEQARVEVAKKQEEDTADRAEKALARQRQRRWIEPRTPTRFNSDTTRPNKTIIESDSALGLSLDVGKGPDALVRDMLEKGLADEVTAGNMTQDQVDAYIKERMQDKVFLAKARVDVMRDLLAVKIRSGGKLSKSEHALIAHSDWGKDIIDNALNENDELRQAFEKVKQQGLIKGDIATAIKDNKNLLYILLGMIAGTVAITAGAPLLAGGIASITGTGVIRK